MYWVPGLSVTSSFLHGSEGFSYNQEYTLSHPGENPRLKICDLWREMAGNTEKISQLEKTEIFVLSPSCLQASHRYDFSYQTRTKHKKPSIIKIKSKT
jgi:hypothetical protein